MPPPPRIPHLRREGRDLHTESADPGRSAYGEERQAFEGVEYRRWDPWRSKLAAYLVRGGHLPPLAAAPTILYLGAAHGTTVSHLHDLAPAARLFAVEKSPTSFASLLSLARHRPGLVPILADARLPERYRADVGPAQFLYQDVAQRDQAAIFLENARAVLDPGAAGLLMLKVRSVTQRRPPGQVLEATRRELAEGGLKLRATVELGPFAREHAAILVEG